MYEAVWLSSQTNWLRLVRHIQAHIKLLPRTEYSPIEVNLVNVIGSQSQFSFMQRIRILV